MADEISLDTSVICVIGLGYVGQPLAEAFARVNKVVGFDTDKKKIQKLRTSNSNNNLLLTNDARDIGKADFIIICVPTPVTSSKEVDLSFIESAAKVTGKNMKKGSVVILESTVYPGVTENVLCPILEKESGFHCGSDFKIGYSPERINPGDEEHSIEKVTKAVSGMDIETRDLLAGLYGRITPHVFKAKDIMTAEAAKVIENVQRDLNIALMNELSIIFEKMGLETSEVLNTAATKWNFQRYHPGLVGGHCIPVDPYYLVHKAQELGYNPRVILAGRSINDNMPRYVAEMTRKALNDVGKVAKGAKVLIAGLTYKEDVVDIRETPARGIIKDLQEYGVKVYGYDPLLENVEREFGIKIVKRPGEIKVDAVILTVVHKVMKEITPGKLKDMMNDSPILIDVRGFYYGSEMTNQGFYYRTL